MKDYTCNSHIRAMRFGYLQRNSTVMVIWSHALWGLIGYIHIGNDLQEIVRIGGLKLLT